MYILKSIAAVIASACLFAASNAHSTGRNPLNYISRLENAVVNTPSHRVHANSKFDLTFDLHGGEQRIRLSLQPNHGVIQEGATVQHLAPDGSIRTSEVLDRSQYRVFKGHTFVQHEPGAEWTNVGWARITIHQDGKIPLFEGAFRFDGNHHHVQTSTHYMQTRNRLDPTLEDAEEDFLVVWRDSDVSRGLSQDHEGNLHPELRRSDGRNPSCSADNLGFNSQADHPVFRALKRDDSFWGVSKKSLFGRQIDGQTFGNSAGINLVENIGSTAGCSTTRRVALVGVATDCTYTAGFNSTEELRKNVIGVLASASVQYEDSFNISLGLKNLIISDKVCPGTPQQSTPWNVACGGNVDIQDRLNLFSAWRGSQTDTNAYWSLFSTCNTDSAVGLAWLGQACVQTSQVASSADGNETVSGANVVVRTSEEWQVFAHESGHTFGAVHDCNAQTCASADTVNAQQCCPLSKTQCDAGGKFIMNPETGDNISNFSPCSIGNICTAIGRNSVKTNCLTQNKDVETITGSQCGNGIVEQGEDCDCGGTEGCGANSCCDATTCKFTQNSVCDPGNEDCCTPQCQFASNGTVCRTSTGVCDPQETCGGTSATCPADLTAPDGQSCGSNSLSCASGQCTSRDLQCKTLMGSYTQGNDTYACSDDGCQISCASPEFGSNICYKMQQNFLDGTSCQGGGKCANGACKGSSVSKEITGWINKNKTLVIALASVIGSIVILSILSCCWSRYRRRKRQAARAAMSRPPPQMWQGSHPQQHHRQHHNQHYNQQQQGWSHQGPPPGYMPNNGGQLSGAWENGRWNPSAPPPVWQPSVRYA